MRTGRRTAALALAALLLLTAACTRRAPARKVELPAGDAVWLAGGVAAPEPDPEPALSRGGLGTVFFPAAAVSWSQGEWKTAMLPPPPHPFARTAVVLVLQTDPPGSSALATPDRIAAWADLLWQAIRPALADGARFGRVAGVHLDAPFQPSEVAAFASAARALRGKLPPGTPLTVSLHAVPGEKDREAWESLGAAVDGFVAFVFGPGAGAVPAPTDRLGRPWWAAYAPGAAGSWTDGGGQDQGSLPEEALALLTDDPRVEVLQNMSLKEEADSVFVLKPRVPVAAGRWTFPAGSRITFRQPSLADMIGRMGGDLAGRRFVRGRVVILPGASDSERIFTLSSLVAVLAGGPIEPELRAAVEPGRGSIHVSAENPTANSSVISRTANWLEVDVDNGGVTDVQSGGFDRYEVFGADGSPVLLGRATRVRFYETLVGPFEKIAPARIALRRVPRDCCPVRSHLLAASGKELSK